MLGISSVISSTFVIMGILLVFSRDLFYIFGYPAEIWGIGIIFLGGFIQEFEDLWKLASETRIFYK